LEVDPCCFFSSRKLKKRKGEPSKYYQIFFHFYVLKINLKILFLKVKQAKCCSQPKSTSRKSLLSTSINHFSLWQFW